MLCEHEMGLHLQNLNQFFKFFFCVLLELKKTENGLFFIEEDNYLISSSKSI